MNRYLAKIGKKGGQARALALTPRQRKAISRKGGKGGSGRKDGGGRSAAARKAIKARWAQWRKVKRES